MEHLFIKQYNFTQRREAIALTQTTASLTRHLHGEVEEVREELSWLPHETPTQQQTQLVLNELVDVILYGTSLLLHLKRFDLIDRLSSIVNGTSDEEELTGTPHELADRLAHHTATLRQWGADSHIPLTDPNHAPSTHHLTQTFHITSTIARSLGCHDFPEVIAAKLAYNGDRFRADEFQVRDGETPPQAFSRAYTTSKIASGERPAGWIYRSH